MVLLPSFVGQTWAAMLAIHALVRQGGVGSLKGGGGGGVAPAFPGGVAPKFGSEKVSRYMGVSQVP